MYTQTAEGGLLHRTDELGERSWREDPVYKCIFSLRGTSTYSTHRGDEKVEKGNMLVLNPNEPHRQLDVSEEKFLVEIHPKMFKDDLHFARLTFRHPLLHQWAAFVKGYLASAPRDENFLEHSIYQLTMLLKQFTVHSEQTTWCLTADNPVFSALKESYSEDWTLTDMAATAHMSKYEFVRSFKKQTGISPYAWLQIYRIVQSQDALKSSKESITSISYQYGFKNVSSYTFYFKRLYGITPLAFRSLYQKNAYARE